MFPYYMILQQNTVFSRPGRPKEPDDLESIGALARFAVQIDFYTVFLFLSILFVIVAMCW